MAKHKPIPPTEPTKVNTAPLATTVNARSGAKVVVACKLPMGMALHLDVKTMQREQTPNGTRDIEVWVADRDNAVRVHGSRVRFGDLPGYEIVGGYALTQNVDRDFWVAWLKQNENQPYVVNELIFAEDTMDAARSRAKNQRTLLSGFEPLNPATRRVHTPNGDEKIEHIDPRWPKRMGNSVGSISEVSEMER